MTWSSLLPFVLLIGAFWLLVIRPTQRQRAAKATLLAAVRPGTEVVTTGGLHGTVVAVEDDDVVLEVADGVQLRFVRAAIGAVKAEPATGTDEDLDPSEERESGEQPDADDSARPT